MVGLGFVTFIVVRAQVMLTYVLNATSKCRYQHDPETYRPGINLWQRADARDFAGQASASCEDHRSDG